jgi:dethiobiotin synthetase
VTDDLLVTGTDTAVGKTVIAAAAILALRERGVRAVGFKPAETGVDPSERSDSEVLAEASGLAEPNAAPLVRLAEPLTPALAAERAGVALDRRAIGDRLRTLWEARYTVIVEGAGGARAPLAWSYDSLDLAAEHLLDVLVVARAGLGTLNHVLLTVDAIERRGLTLAGVVLNGAADPPDLAERTNPDVLARLRPDLRVLSLPRVPGADAIGAARVLAPFVGRWLTARA